MSSLRSKSSPAGLASALTLFCLLLLAALPVVAIAAPVEPEEPATPQLAFEPGSYDFGMQEANRSNAQTWMQLRNNGAAAAQVYSVKIVGAGANAFWFSYNDCDGQYLSPSETCSVQVNFGPNDAIPFDAQLRASSEGGTTFTAELSGEGGRAALGPVSEPANFGAAAVGSAGVTKTIEIVNGGNLPGGSFIAVIAGGAIGSFHLLDENCTGVMLSPAASCTLLVNFQPLSTGVKTARLGLFGDSDGGTQVTLTGIGLDPVPAPASSAAEAPAASASGASRARKNRARRGRTVHRHRRLRAALGARSKIG
jgi:hypothetical protein